MRFAKKLQRRQQEKEKALYVRLPHVIRNEEDVAKLFTGDFKVKLLRQSSRYCYVIFSDVKEKMKNLKATKDKLINGKRVVVAPAITKLKEDPRKLIKKKIVVPKVKKDVKVTKTLFVSNIKCGTKLEELRAAIPGCVSIKMLKPYSKKSRGAMIKMESIQLAAEYLKKIREWPVIEGHKLRINPDTRKKQNKPRSNTPLKIYDGELETKENSNRTRKCDPLDHIVLENKS